MANEGGLWKIRASVPTGLEISAAEECSAVLGVKPVTFRGCVEFTVSSLDQLHQVDSLRSVDNFSVVITEIKDFCQDKSNVLQRLESLPLAGGSEWLNALKAWRFYNSHVLKKGNVTGGTSTNKKTVLVNENVSAEADKVSQDESLLVTEKDLTASSTPCCVSKGIPSPPLGLGGSSLGLGGSSLGLGGSLDMPPSPSTGVNQESQSDLSSAQMQSLPHAQEPVQNSTSVPEPVQNSTSAPEPEQLLSTIANEFESISFRVTATRSGPKTLYSSVDAAKFLGSGVISSFKWSVNLKKFDVEILLSLNDEGIIVGVALTRESKYYRNLTYFGPTSLRATIAHGLLRLAHPKPGDIILDPMCGGGSITIEGFHSFPGTYHIGGDIHTLACKRTKDNVTAMITKAMMGVASSSVVGGVPLEVIQWDICRLPLRTASIDVIVTDMPFGKKIGSKVNNWNLYRRSLEECGRVCVPGTGRGIFMTHDTKAISAAMKALSSLWQRYRTYWINLGGLRTGVHVLLRTKMKMF